MNPDFCVRPLLFRPAEHLQRPVIVALRSDGRKQPGDGFDIMRKNFRCRRQDGINRGRFTLKIRYQHFHGTRRLKSPDRMNGRRKNRGAAVLQFITIHGSQHRVA